MSADGIQGDTPHRKLVSKHVDDPLRTITQTVGFLLRVSHLDYASELS